MGYRIKEHPEPKPHRDIEAIDTPSKIWVKNGSISNFAIPCLYLVVDAPERAHCHSQMHHDHVGWPSPNHPDHICQPHDFAHSCCSCNKKSHCKDFLDMKLMKPIHLSKEGYEKITIALDDAPNGVKMTGSIDPKRDWIIRIITESNTEEAIKEMVHVPFTIFASGVVSGRQVKDVVTSGLLRIYPGPIEEI